MFSTSTIVYRCNRLRWISMEFCLLRSSVRSFVLWNRLLCWYAHVLWIWLTMKKSLKELQRTLNATNDAAYQTNVENQHWLLRKEIADNIHPIKKQFRFQLHCLSSLFDRFDGNVRLHRKKKFVYPIDMKTSAEPLPRYWCTYTPFIVHRILYMQRTSNGTIR